jgi:hypothetical protein
MTIEMQITFSPMGWPHACRALLALEGGMKPREWSEWEDGKRVSSEGMEMAIEEKGGFLWAPLCEYDVTKDKVGRFTFMLRSKEIHFVSEMFYVFVSLGLDFGYACMVEEREHRNRIIKRMPYGVHEAWVGRDFSLYLPGVYWLTVISERLLGELGIEFKILEKVSKSIRTVGGNVVLQLYDDPNGWAAHSVRLDAWCSDTVGVFSKLRVEEQLTSATSFLEVSNVCGAWR